MGSSLFIAFRLISPWKSRGLITTGLKDDAGTVSTADLPLWIVDLHTAAVDRSGLARLAMQGPRTAHARPIVVHHRLAATRVRPENALADFRATADLRGAVVLLFPGAAGEVAAVDHVFSAAVRVTAVDPGYGRAVAAPVGPVVVDHVAAAGGVAAVDTVPDRVTAAQ